MHHIAQRSRPSCCRSAKRPVLYQPAERRFFGDSQISGKVIYRGNRGGCHGAGCCGADGLYG